ncbi:MAG: ABC transporter substrate-binding protein [Actinomycetota bacterium]
MIDQPGPWGTGPFVLTEGYSSMHTRCAIMRPDPFTCAWLIEEEDRSDRVVLEAYRNHWNTERGPRLERVVFRSDLSPAEALDLCISTEGEVDIVTEVSPADADRVITSDHAELVRADANRVLVGIINRYPSDVPLSDRRARQALNFAVDRQKVVSEGLLGHGSVLCALTPSWCSGFPPDAKPYPHDPERARKLMAEADWPEGRALRVATPGPFEGIARLVASDVEASLGIGVEVSVVPEGKLLAGAQMLVEKKLAPPWDVLVFGWFDLSSEAPPAAVHREFFGSDGAFRAGPELPEFDRLYAEMVAQTDGQKLVEVAERIDAHAFDEALALFLCAPQALYAVNKHVSFGPYRTTFELAEVEVGEQHWSRRAAGSNPGGAAAAGRNAAAVSFSGAMSGHAC